MRKEVAKRRSPEEVEKLVQSLVIPKEHIKGDPTMELYKMRYGTEWKKYYPRKCKQERV